MQFFQQRLSKNSVLPLFSQAIGANDVVIGLVSAVFPLAGILFSLPVGILSDQLGRRKLLAVSGIVFFFLHLCCIFLSVILGGISRFVFFTASPRRNLCCFCDLNKRQKKSNRHLVTVVLNSVCAIVWPVKAQSMDSRSAVG
jgi:MFS family permease